MPSKATSVEQYLDGLPADRKAAVATLRETIVKNLPKGFREGMAYGMPAYGVPHEIYPAGYHCDPKQPLPFMSIASQKNFIALYHMGLYAMPDLLEWFTAEYPKHTAARPDMGKVCVRFKKPEQIPYKLIAALVKKVSVKDWVEVYEKNVKR